LASGRQVAAQSEEALAFVVALVVVARPSVAAAQSFAAVGAAVDQRSNSVAGPPASAGPSWTVALHPEVVTSFVENLAVARSLRLNKHSAPGRRRIPSRSEQTTSLEGV